MDDVEAIVEKLYLADDDDAIFSIVKVFSAHRHFHRPVQQQKRVPLTRLAHKPR